MNTVEERAAEYRLLSLCFHPPDEQLLEALRETGLPGLVPSASPALDELQREYARLFVGPFTVPAPPYGSVYLENEGRVLGESTMDVMARYAEEGLRTTLKEPADHVAIELEYVYLLAFREMEAAAAGDTGRAARYRDKRQAFLRAHLGAWMPRLKERIAAHAQMDFYRDVAVVTASVVSADLDLLRDRIT
ncbi:MAG: TorD/DmsD family molecular chaperone [Planctomycetota bacterium]